MDENGALYATFTYNGYGEATGSWHAGDADKVTISVHEAGHHERGQCDGYRCAERISNLRIHGCSRCALIDGHHAACGEWLGNRHQSYGYDANGNTTRRINYRGVMSCYSFDLTRNLETSRTEGLTGTTCPGTAVAGVTRTTTTQWSPTYRLPTQIDVYAGATATGTPLRRTTFGHCPNGTLQTRTISDLTVTPNVSAHLGIHVQLCRRPAHGRRSAH